MAFGTESCEFQIVDPSVALLVRVFSTCLNALSHDVEVGLDESLDDFTVALLSIRQATTTCDGGGGHLREVLA